MNSTINDKALLEKILVRRLEPLGHIHTYKSFKDANRHLINKCNTLHSECSISYFYEIFWEPDYHMRGELTIDSSMKTKEDIIQDSMNLTLANDLLLYILTPDKESLMKIVLRLQWQMERLMLDQKKKEQSLAIITHCEGIDEDKILAGYDMLQNMTDSVDMFLPLLRRVFPNAQQKLENIRLLNNRSKAFIREAVTQYQRYAADVLTYALNNETKKFDKSWEKLVDYCVKVSEEQKFADERLTFIGKNLYFLGQNDIDFVKNQINGQLVPFSEEASIEFRLRDKLIKQNYFKKQTVSNKLGSSTPHDYLYMELYADMYVRKAISNISRKELSVYVARELFHNYKIGLDEIKHLILTVDPMAVQCPSYPDIVLATVFSV